MKIRFQLAALILICIGASLKAQTYKKTTVRTGESIPEHSWYLYPSFADATIKLKRGGQLESKVNFNLLICEMQFLGPANDTLTIAKPDEVDSIILNSNVFFFNNGYYEIISSAGNAKLVVLRKASYKPVKIGALGLPNHSGTGIQSYTSVVTTVGERKLVMNEDVDITGETAYFLINNNNPEMIKANKQGFIKLFSNNSDSIQGYIKQNKTEFNKQSDLEKLFAFCVAQH